MFNWLIRLFTENRGTISGITQASLVSAITDATGDDGPDAIVKIRRLINKKGASFVHLAEFPFLTTSMSFTLNTLSYEYSGASYIPSTFKRVTASWLTDGNTKHSLFECSSSRFHDDYNPEDDDGLPEEFCIERIVDSYWNIKFNVRPDTAYVANFLIEKQWVDLTSTTSETVITTDFYDYFSHYCIMSRFLDQGDKTNYTLYKNEWNNPKEPSSGIFNTMMRSMRSPRKMNGVRVLFEKFLPYRVGLKKRDYNDPNDIME